MPKPLPAWPRRHIDEAQGQRWPPFGLGAEKGCKGGGWGLAGGILSNRTGPVRKAT